MSRRRKQPVLGPDWRTWPIEAQVELLNYLRSLDKPGEQFKRTYRNNYVAFAHDCIMWPEGEGPTAYQDEIFTELPLRHRCAIRGPHGLGKTMLAAVCLICFATANDGDDWKIPTTASAWRQLSEFFWPEVHKWAARVKWDRVGRPAFTQYELQTMLLKLASGRAFAMASSDDELTEGAHADHLLYIFDEAKAIPPGRWDAAEGALMTGDCVLGSAVVSASVPELATRRWHKGQVLKIQTRGGHSLTVTPNHPILTARGWVRAKLLHPSDQIASCRDAEALMMLIEPDSIQVPTKIEDIFKSYSVVYRSLPNASKALTAENLDSAFLKSHVNIEPTDSLLNGGNKTVFSQGPVNLGFVDGCNSASEFSGLGGLDQLSFWLSFTSPSTTAQRSPIESPVGIACDMNSLGGGGITSLDSPVVQSSSDNPSRDTVLSCQRANGFSVPERFDKRFSIRRKPFRMTAPHSPRLDTVASQIVRDSPATDVEFFTKLNSVAPGNVFLDQITNLTWAEFEGHVYDLQTGTHWFTANDSTTNSQNVGGIIIHNCYALAISTPGEPQGRFYDIHSRKPGYENWWTRHVTVDEMIAAGRMTWEKVEQYKRQWGENSAVFKNRILGEFCESNEDCVIPLEWIEAANKRWHERIELIDKNWNWIEGAKHGTWPRWRWRNEAYPVDALGVDIARSDKGDKTVIARRQGKTVTQLDRYAIADTQPVVGYATNLLERWVSAYAVVDMIGIGSGPYDQLREKFGTRAVPFNAGEATDVTDRSKELYFADKRSAAWWNMRELLDPAYDSDVALPPCDVLTGDLTAPRRGRMTASGKLRVESKDDLRKPTRLGRSTDDGDAVVQSFFPKKKAIPEDPAFSYSYEVYA